MNGHARDAIATDLGEGRPTLSPVADPLALAVAELMTGAERKALFDDLDREVAGSPAWSRWVAAPTVYLSDLDPPMCLAIERRLLAERDRLTKRAVERGWEVR
jgi:hypothetical protein